MGNTYNKEQLVKDVAGLGLILCTKKGAKDTVEFIIQRITENLSSGNDVKISGLANFKLGTQAAKTGKVPGTDVEYTSPEKRVVRISPTAPLKDAVSGQ